MTKELIQLIEREADLMYRNRPTKSLQGLRQRILDLFLKVCSTTVNEQLQVVFMYWMLIGYCIFGFLEISHLGVCVRVRGHGLKLVIQELHVICKHWLLYEFFDF